MTKVVANLAGGRGSSRRRRYDLEILGSLRRIIQAFDVHSRHLSATVDVTLPQLVCLIAIVAEEGMVARQLSSRVHVGTSTLVGVLDRLEAKGLIERVRDRDDRRRIFVVPTERGREMIRSAPSPFGEDFDASFQRLSLARRQELAESLETIAGLVQPQEGASS